MRVKELLEAEAAFVFRQAVSRLQSNREVTVLSLIARERLDLHEEATARG
jgi:hypothetical protein